MSKKIADHLRDPLEEQGWQQMKVLLDREMPESKRRMIWLPLMGAAAAIALLILGYQYISIDAEQTALASNLTSDSPDLLHRAQANSHSEKILDSIPLNSDFDVSATFKTETASNSPVPPIKNIQNQKVGSSINHEKLANQHHSQQDNDLLYDDKREVVTVLENPSPPIESETSSYNNPQGGSETNYRTPTLIADWLPSLKYIYPIHRNEWFEPMPIEHVIDVPRDPLVDFSIATGMLTDNSVSKPSFDLGGQIRLKPSGKIAIGLGSFFWSINSNQTFSAVSSPTNSFTGSKDFALSADQGIQRADSVSAPQAGLSYYSSQVNNLAYWRVPVFIQFFPTGKWQPYIGASQNILLSDGSQGLLESNASTDFNSINSGANPSRPIADLVRMNNTAFLVGLTFQTYKHLAIDLAYAHSKLSYLNYSVSEGDFYEYHRFLRLSLAYRF